MIWFNFFLSLLYALELIVKNYAFGMRRAYSTSHWVMKCEFFY